MFFHGERKHLQSLRVGLFHVGSRNPGVSSDSGCHLDFYYPLAFFKWSVSIINLLDVSGRGSPLNWTGCSHRCADLSLCLFLYFSHWALKRVYVAHTSLLSAELQNEAPQREMATFSAYTNITCVIFFGGAEKPERNIEKGQNFFRLNVTLVCLQIQAETSCLPCVE